MVYKDYTVADLAAFSGRLAASYDPTYAPTAIAQALLLWKIGTCLAAPPEDATQAQLVDMAILSMADAITLAQPYQTALASPFNSESIGSYSYSRTAKAIVTGMPTGIMWFDLGVGQLGQCDTALSSFPMSGGIEVFEHDAQFVTGEHNNTRMLSPQDLHRSQAFGFDVANGVPIQIIIDGGADELRTNPDTPGFLDYVGE